MIKESENIEEFDFEPNFDDFEYELIVDDYKKHKNRKKDNSCY